MASESEIDDAVQLSNKACPRYYGSMVDGKLVGSKRCACPEGRCWYDENKARRRQGLKAIEFNWSAPPNTQEKP